MPRALILAAGRGSRVKRLTDSKPKCMIEINDHTLLAHQIDRFKSNGINDIAVVTGYKHDSISHPSISKYFHNALWQKTNMVYSMLCAIEWLIEDTTIISYSDVLYSSEAIRLLESNTHDIALTSFSHYESSWINRYDDPLVDIENFQVDSNGMLTKIGGHPNTIQEVHGQFMGLLKLESSSLSTILKCVDSLDNQCKTSLDMTTLLQMLLQTGTPISTTQYDDYWFEIDTIMDYEYCLSKLNSLII